MIAFFAFF